MYCEDSPNRSTVTGLFHYPKKVDFYSHDFEQNYERPLSLRHPIQNSLSFLRSHPLPSPLQAVDQMAEAVIQISPTFQKFLAGVLRHRVVLFAGAPREAEDDAGDAAGAQATRRLRALETARRHVLVEDQDVARSSSPI